MAGERSGENADKATADQPPVSGEPAYEPEIDEKAGVAAHEEPIDGTRPDPDELRA